MRRIAQIFAGIAILGVSAVCMGFGFSVEPRFADVALVKYGAATAIVAAGGLVMMLGIYTICDALFDDGYEWW